MAELNLVLKYKYLPTRIIFLMMLATLPVWEIVFPIAVGYLIRSLLWSHNVPADLAAVLIPALLAAIVLCIAITGCSEDNRIHISKEGFSFPPFLLPFLKFRRAKEWSQLMQAGLINSEKSKSKILALGFSDGSTLHLNLSCFNNSDIEQLLLAISLWAKNCQRSQELIAYENELPRLQDASGESQGSYTALWEDELNRRFQTTSFVPLEPGQKLQEGKIEVIRQLAFGGLSAIYLVQDKQSELVVLKEAVVPDKADEEMRAAAERHLLKEAELLSRFRHEGAAKVIDHFIENGRHYLKLEYINGSDLRQYIKQHGPLDEDNTIEWGLQILEVLEALHKQDPPILHRDLTPENIVFAKGKITVIDFGAANEFVGSATGTVVGKQCYMPAEQLRGKSSIQSDIYAFGCTLYYLLCGKDPLPLSVSRPSENSCSLSQELDDLIARCTAFEPSDRPTSAAELSGQLRQIQDHKAGLTVFASEKAN